MPRLLIEVYLCKDVAPPLLLEKQPDDSPLFQGRRMGQSAFQRRKAAATNGTLQPSKKQAQREKETKNNVATRQGGK